MDQAHSSRTREDSTDFSFVNTACLIQIAADMDYAQSLPEPIVEPEGCHCQICLCTLQDNQDNQSRTKLQLENFRLQTQPKLKVVEQKLNDKDKVIKQTKATTKRSGQGIEQIAKAQQYEKDGGQCQN